MFMSLYFLSSHSFLFLFMCPKIFLFLLLQTFIRFSPVISSSSKENGRFFCDMVGFCQGTISRSASPSQSRKNMVKSFDFYPFSSLVCLSVYVVNNMKWEPRWIPLLMRGMHDVHKKKWCEMKDWDSVSLDAQTQCVSLLLVLFQLYWLSLTFPNWYAFLILFSLSLIPPWPSYSCLWWLLFFLLFSSFYLYSVCYSQNFLQALCRNPEPDPWTSNGGKEKLPLPGTNYEQDQAHMEGALAADGVIKCLIVYISLFSTKGSFGKRLEWLQVTRKCCFLLRLMLWNLQVIIDLQIKWYNN